MNMCLLQCYVSQIFVAMSLIICGDVHPNPGPNTDDVSLLDSSISHSNSDSLDIMRDIDSNFSIIHLNVQSLRPKRDILNGNLSDFDILCFSESWLNDEIPNSEIMFDGFNTPYRHDRND